MSDFPEELYVGPSQGMQGDFGDDLHAATNFDNFPEGTRVALYVFAGTATVKVRREALLIDEDSKIIRSAIQYPESGPGGGTLVADRAE